MFLFKTQNYCYFLDLSFKWRYIHPNTHVLKMGGGLNNFRLSKADTKGMKEITHHLNRSLGTSQWLRLHISNAGSLGSILGQGTKFSHA